MKEAAKIIGISIRTAPKSAGVDDIQYRIVSDRQKERLAQETKNIAYRFKKGKPADVQKAISLDWHSDADTVSKADCLILIGVLGRKPLGFNCGGCGFKSCQEFQEAKQPETIFMPGPFCMFKLLDLGIALASAAKTAAVFNIDNRIIYRAGIAGYTLGLLGECNPIMGLPLSATGKNIFFDRKEKIEAKELWKQIKRVDSSPLRVDRKDYFKQKP